MTMTTSDAIPAPSVNTLAGLRAVAFESSHSATSMLNVADCQAWLLRTTLPIPIPATRIPAQLSILIPTVCIDYVDNIPVPGVAFWGNGHWHVHIRADDPEETQAFTALHELKHIIDHPLRQQPNPLTHAEWEAIADHFANRVLASEASQVAMSEERRNSL